jgi:hypothetical protein
VGASATGSALFLFFKTFHLGHIIDGESFDFFAWKGSDLIGYLLVPVESDELLIFHGVLSLHYRGKNFEGIKMML